MGTTLVQPDSFAAAFAAIERRLHALETTPPLAMNLLTDVQGVGSTSGFVATMTPIVGGPTATFSLSRPATVWIVGYCAYYTSGGSANYVYVQLGLDANTNVSSHSAAALGAVGTSMFYLTRTLQPGTYTAQLYYDFSGGAGSSLITIGTPQVTAFAMGG